MVIGGCGDVVDLWSGVGVDSLFFSLGVSVVQVDSDTLWDIEGGHGITDLEPVEIEVGLSGLLLVWEASTIVLLVCIFEEAGRLGSVVDSHG